MKNILNKLVNHVSNGGTVESFMRQNANECQHLFTSLYGSESVCEYCRMTPDEIHEARGNRPTISALRVKEKPCPAPKECKYSCKGICRN